MVDVSIIIVSYNSEQFISRCLSSIFDHRTQLSYEVIVIDNASTDKTVEMITKYSQVKLVINDKNVGFSKANNSGIRQAKGKYLLFLNPDVQLNDFCLDRLIETLQRNEQIAIVAPKLVYTNGEHQESARRFPNLFVQLFGRIPLLKRLVQRQHKVYLMKAWDSQSSQAVDWVIGAAMLCRKKDILEIGMFDESFFLYCEDTDLCYRFTKKGYKIFYRHDVVLEHDYQKSSSSKFSKLTYIHFLSMMTFYRKHPELIFNRLAGE